MLLELSVSCLSLYIKALSTPIRADYTPYNQSTDYDNGLFSPWPRETYRSTPFLGTADDTPYTFLTAHPKTAFETSIVIPPHTTPSQTPYRRILALNARGTILSATRLDKWDPDANELAVSIGGPVELSGWI